MPPTTTHTPSQLLTQAAFAAWQLGEPIQYKGQADVWRDFMDTSPYFNKDLEWRPAPVPAPPRPWSAPGHVPGPVCWLRHKQEPKGVYMPTSIWPDGIAITFKGNAYFFTWHTCTEYYEHSTDRITWKPCVVEEGDD